VIFIGILQYLLEGESSSYSNIVAAKTCERHSSVNELLTCGIHYKPKKLILQTSSKGSRKNWGSVKGARSRCRGNGLWGGAVCPSPGKISVYIFKKRRIMMNSNVLNLMFFSRNKGC
jgi:hypothetical protein